MAQETYYHWSVFADGSAGVCVQFKRNELIAAIKRHKGIRSGPVKYLTVKEIEKRKLKIKELPFTKRYPYVHESEWRIVYESQTVTAPVHYLPIPISSIARISLSPWLPDALKDYVKKSVWAIKDCAKLEIARSTLIDNERWKKVGDDAA